jgi:hypothetical protein
LVITETAFLLCKANPKTITSRLVQPEAFLREISWLQ